MKKLHRKPWWQPMRAEHLPPIRGSDIMPPVSMTNWRWFSGWYQVWLFPLGKSAITYGLPNPFTLYMAKRMLTEQGIPKQICIGDPKW